MLRAAKVLIILAFSFFYSCQDSYPILEDSIVVESPPFKEIMLLNYANNYQNIHPKVLFSEEGILGHKYWMTYTPYPNGDIHYENICLAVSNDGLYWKHLKTNKPITTQYTYGYNSDPHLLFREDLQQLEVWYRPYNINTSQSKIVRIISKDGFSWSKEEVIWSYDYSQKLSPAVIYEDNKYKMWYCDRELIMYTECSDILFKTWSIPKVVSINSQDLKFWHIDVIARKNVGYEFLVCAYENNGNNNTCDLYYFKYDNNRYSSLKLIIEKKLEENSIIERGLYRSSFIKYGDYYHIYGSSIDLEWNRHLFFAKFDHNFNIVNL